MADASSSGRISPDLAYIYLGGPTNAGALALFAPIPTHAFAQPSPPTESVSQFNQFQASLDLLASGFYVADSAASIQADIDALEADTHLINLTFTDATPPTLTLTVAQALALPPIATSNYTIDIVDAAANLISLTPAQIAGLGAEHVTTLTSIDSSMNFTPTQGDALKALGIQVVTPSGDHVREGYSDGTAKNWFYGANGVATRLRDVHADGSADVYFYTAGYVDGFAFAYIDEKITSTGDTPVVNYDDAHGGVLVSEYPGPIGNPYSYYFYDTINPDGTDERHKSGYLGGAIGFGTQQTDVSQGVIVAHSVDAPDPNLPGSLRLLGSNLTVTAGKISLPGGPNDFTWDVGYSSEFYNFVAGTNNRIVMTPLSVWSSATVKGFGVAGTGDVVDLSLLFPTFSDALAAMSQEGSTLVAQYRAFPELSFSITLLNVQKYALTPSDLGYSTTAPDNFPVSDTAANISGSFDFLNSDLHVQSITLTDAAPLLTLTLAQALDDTRAFQLITNTTYSVDIFDTAAHLMALTPARIATLASEHVATLTSTDASMNFNPTQGDALKSAGIQFVAPYGDHVREAFTDGSAMNWVFGGDGVVTKMRDVHADGSLDIYLYTPGTIEGINYAYEHEFVSPTGQVTATLDDAQGNVVIPLYLSPVGVFYAFSDTINPDGTEERRATGWLNGTTGVESYQTDISQGVIVAHSIDAGTADNNQGSLRLLGSNLTVAVGHIGSAGGVIGLPNAPNDFTFNPALLEAYNFVQGTNNRIILDPTPLNAWAVVTGLGVAGTNDILDITALFGTFSDARAAMTQDGSDLLIQMRNGSASSYSIVVRNMQLGAATASEFGF